MSAASIDETRAEARPARRRRTPDAARALRARARRRMRVSIAGVLAAGFGGLVALAVASVLALGLWGAGSNTYGLLVDKANLTLDAVERRVRGQLDPARAQAAFLADEIVAGRLSFDEPDAMIATMRGVLAATPHVTGIMALAPDMANARVARMSDGIVGTAEPLASADAEYALQGLVAAQDRTRPYWAEPVWAEELQASLISLRHPVRDGDRYLGFIAVAVSLADLSRFLTDLFVEDGQNGSLLLGRDRVLAHPSLAGAEFRFRPASGEPPVPTLDRVGDPVLSALATASAEESDRVGDLVVRVFDAAGSTHLALERPLPGYGPDPWTLAVVQPVEAVSAPLDLLWTMGAAGIAILAAALAAAVLIAKRLSLRIARFAAAAESIRALDFRNTPTLPASRVRELDDTARAFNAMTSALAWFEAYVPKGLVLDLMRRGGDGVRSQARTLTIMFSDIRGFTAQSDLMGPEQVAELLNHHFALVGACIEAEGGTVDKFIGDAVMAFWNAPGEQADHAARALRAARAIGLALAADNAERVAAGLDPVRVSIGLHTGPVIVGNIGTGARMNYTIVGGAVNVASRLEAAAAERQGDAEVLILASEACARAAGAAPDEVEEVGPLFLRGVGEPVPAYRIPVG
jgi:adenylate cyclase